MRLIPLEVISKELFQGTFLKSLDTEVQALKGLIEIVIALWYAEQQIRGPMVNL